MGRDVKIPSTEEVKAAVAAAEAEIYLDWGEVATNLLETAVVVSTFLRNPQGKRETALLIKKIGDLLGKRP